jgi:hypothetical protein
MGEAITVGKVTPDASNNGWDLTLEGEMALFDGGPQCTPGG